MSAGFLKKNSGDRTAHRKSWYDFSSQPGGWERKERQKENRCSWEVWVQGEWFKGWRKDGDMCLCIKWSLSLAGLKSSPNLISKTLMDTWLQGNIKYILLKNRHKTPQLPPGWPQTWALQAEKSPSKGFFMLIINCHCCGAQKPAYICN